MPNDEEVVVSNQPASRASSYLVPARLGLSSPDVRRISVLVPLIFTLETDPLQPFQTPRKFLPMGVFQILMVHLFNSQGWKVNKGIMYRDYVEFEVGEQEKNLLSLSTSQQMIILNFLDGDKSKLVEIRKEAFTCFKSIQEQYHPQMQARISVDPCQAGDPSLCIHLLECLHHVCSKTDTSKCFDRVHCQNKNHQGKTMECESFKAWFELAEASKLTDDSGL